MRCYLMNDGHIAAVEVLEDAPDDAAAIREATAIFLGCASQYQGFELWDDGRLVYRCPGGTPLASAMPEAIDPLLEAYQEVIIALRTRAKNCEPDQVVEWIHRANNLQAIVDGYERLNAKRQTRASEPD
jgi:hypothetical protein